MTEPMIVDNPAAAEFTVDRETRTIRGLAMPYGGDVAASKGQRWTFSKGTITAERAKVLVNHDWNQAVGTATFDDTDEGLFATLRIARGAEGDRVLSLAEDGVYDGLSVGFGEEIQARLVNGVQHVVRSVAREVSVTPAPAFTRARITSVAASATHTEEQQMTSTATEATEATETPTFSQADGAALAAQVKTLGEQLDKLGEIKVPVATAQFAVTEEPMYRFSGTERAPSGFDFAEDVFKAAMKGDDAAMARVVAFTNERMGYEAPEFVATPDTANINPATYRPDMFLGQAPTPTSPLYDFFRKGALTSVQPFYWSKLDRVNTTVGIATHVEGVEPAVRELKTVVGTTVTPAPVSGKVHITREVADQGGNPSVSGLVYAEFDRSLKIAYEQRTAALIAASAAAIADLNASAIAAGANGAVAGQNVERGLLGLQFLADGDRFEKAFGHVDLYTALATFENTDGSKRYPIINPQNRNGIVGSKFSFIDVAGYRMEPTHSLGATSANASNSYVADSAAVHVWGSGLQRFDKLMEKVEGYDIGVFAYFAGVVYDATGLRKIAYDPIA